MSDLMKRKKADLIGLLQLKEKHCEAAVERAEDAEGKLRKANFFLKETKEELVGSKLSTTSARDKLSDIQTSINTIVATKYPGFSPLNYVHDSYIIQAEQRTSDEPEDYLLLRYLYQLADK